MTQSTNIASLRPKKLPYLFAAICSLNLLSATEIHSVSSDAKDQANLNITIYNEELALINEERSVALQSGMNQLLLKDVSAQIISETSQLSALSGTPLHIIEQNFDYDLLSPLSLIKRAVGSNVEIIAINPKSGKEERENATILATNNGVVLQYSDRIETGIPNNARIAYHSIPNNLRASPTLSTLLESKENGERQLKLTYLSQGFRWKADYVANLSDDESTLDLSAWITLHNESGTSFNNASIQLVAGDLNRATPHYLNAPSADLYASMRMNVREKSQAVQESFADYHLYRLPFKTTLLNQQEKQVSLLNQSAIPVTKEYRFYSKPYYFGNPYPKTEKNIKADVYYKLTNSEENNLGIPLPKGIFRLYQEDSRGDALFMGEDNINHIAKNESFEVKSGAAFDVSLTRKQSDFQRFSKERSQSTYKITINNARENDVTVNLYERFTQFQNWEIIDESHPHQKESHNSALWLIDVPANGKATLTYTVELRSN